MAKWVKILSAAELPAEGQLVAAGVDGLAVCLARVAGCLYAVSDICPHRQAPLHEGWVEDGKVVCPWHSWAFDPATGLADYPEGEKVTAYAVKVEGADVLAELPD